ncbi:MAG: DUF2934 domain-containing protein [Geminicoccaceae bacterium]
MDDDLRRAVEHRAYVIWQEAGCPDGCADEHWRQAEAELAVPAADRLDAPTADLQRSVDEAVPDAEKLSDRADENPISEQVEKAGRRTTPKPARSTLKGGAKVAR